MAQDVGLTYRMWDKDEFPRWSMPALEAGVAAQRQGDEAFHRFHENLFGSFFLRSQSLIDKDNLVSVARQSGLDVNIFERDIGDQTLQAAVQKQCEEAVEDYLVTAVPTVIIGGKRRRVGMVSTEDYLADLAMLGVE
jgi:predicted DsbA family dithiol-disulfide isomerase